MWRLLTLHILWPPLCVWERKNARLSLVYEGLIHPTIQPVEIFLMDVQMQQSLTLISDWMHHPLLCERARARARTNTHTHNRCTTLITFKHWWGFVKTEGGVRGWMKGRGGRKAGGKERGNDGREGWDEHHELPPDGLEALWSNR